MRSALRDWLRPVVEKAAIMAEHGRRYTITVSDVAYTLKSMGRTLYGYDWSYASVRARVVRPLHAEALVRAAARRASAMAAAAGKPSPQQQQQQAHMQVPTPAACAQTPAAPAETVPAAGKPVAQVSPAASPARTASQQLQPSNQENVPPGSRLAGGDSFRVASVVGEQAAVGEGEVVQPMQEDVAVDNADDGDIDGCSAPSPVASVLAKHEPRVLTTERALEIQAHMSALMHRQLSRRGSISRRELFAEVPVSLPCEQWEMAGEARSGGVHNDAALASCPFTAQSRQQATPHFRLLDVLYTLEHEEEAIMTEGDTIYMAS